MDIPSTESIIKYPCVIILQFGQPLPIPQARVDEGDIGRDLIPFVDFENIDQTDLFLRRVTEEPEHTPEESAKELSLLIDSLPLVEIFTMEDTARQRSGELAEMLYNYGLAYSVKVANYTQKKNCFNSLHLIHF